MATLTVNDLSVAGGGATVSLSAASGGGDDVPNDGRTFVLIDNASGGPHTVTFDSIRPSSYGTDVDPQVVVAAGTQQLVGPFNVHRYSDSLGVTYSGTGSLTIGAFRLPLPAPGV